VVVAAVVPVEDAAVVFAAVVSAASVVVPSLSLAHASSARNASEKARAVASIAGC
jgi:hypothetical protein